MGLKTDRNLTFSNILDIKGIFDPMNGVNNRQMSGQTAVGCPEGS